jgi:hypothetical protein
MFALPPSASSGRGAISRFQRNDKQEVDDFVTSIVQTHGYVPTAGRT